MYTSNCLSLETKSNSFLLTIVQCLAKPLDLIINTALCFIALRKWGGDFIKPLRFFNSKQGIDQREIRDGVWTGPRCGLGNDCTAYMPQSPLHSIECYGICKFQSIVSNLSRRTREYSQPQTFRKINLFRLVNCNDDFLSRDLESAWH